MKFKALIATCVLAASSGLSGCVTYGQTGMLVTPLGVAGIHKFAPVQKSPDDMSEAERTAQRIAKAMD